LLITITLLAFLVILLVGLATYTRVETAIAGNTQRQAQARQNALFALNVAVAQLQKHAGPDTRVTTTAAVIDGAVAQKRRYTGVWDTTAAPGTAPVWLASGLEAGATIDVTANIGAANRIELVGTNTDGTNAANNTYAALQNITAPGVPGRTGNATIGRYAWWIGDNGVKADVARPNLTAQLNYPPFVDSANAANSEARTRLLQQTGLGAGAFATATSTAVFDPRDTANLTLAANTLATQQIPYLRNTAGTALGLTQLKTHYHHWTVGNHAVLARANAAPGAPSLRNDLSLNPGALGTAFTAWSDYPTYMEDPEANPLPGGPSQAASALRRRYKMTPAVTDANGSQFGVTPVLSYAAIAFSIRNDSNSNPTKLECSMRAVLELWNPYTGALVPEDLEVRVTGLPGSPGVSDVLVRDLRSPPARVDIQNLFGDTSIAGSPIRFTLPWLLSTANDQYASWLPGRVYNWSAISSPATAATVDHPMAFDDRDLQQGSGQGIVRDVGVPFAVSSGVSTANYNARTCFVFGGPIVLNFEIRRVSDGVVLATFLSPPFNDFSSGSNPEEVHGRALDFAFVFRLADPVDGFAWLTTAGHDPRQPLPSISAVTPYLQPGNAVDPAAFVVNTAGKNVATFTAGNPSLLLDRYPGTATSRAGTDPIEDVPLFELPRWPLLSLGQLQHLSIPTLQPFWIGQSAASAGPVEWNNALFDQHFFSGLGKGVPVPDLTRPFPNTLVRLLRHKPDGTAVKIDDLIQAPPVLPDPETPDVVPPQPPTAGPTARYLLQGGAFNLNSVDPDAWAAVLRSVRFPTGREFRYLNSLKSTGTAADTSTLSLVAEAAFPRFSQSAQETYNPGSGSQSEPGTSTNTVVRTDYYRQGFRTLDAATVTALAQNIATAIRTRITTTGPFYSLEEFLNPANGVGTPSLLEQAIIDLNLNVLPNADPEATAVTYPFSSTFLTQADIMTVLAPVLFVRSDTFTIRTYGEATNPATGLTEGKAWCEAIVQRFPEPFSPAIPNQPTDEEYQAPPGEFGRRFKIISLRWLTKSDI
jgi:hypothetical protein